MYCMYTNIDHYMSYVSVHCEVHNGCTLTITLPNTHAHTEHVLYVKICACQLCTVHKLQQLAQPCLTWPAAMMSSSALV